MHWKSSKTNKTFRKAGTQIWKELCETEKRYDLN